MKPSLFRSITTAFALTFGTLVCAPLAILLIPLTGGAAFSPLARIWSGFILWASGVRVVRHGFEGIPADRACVFMLNHQGNFDIYLMCRYIPGAWRGLAKKELFRSPIFGWAIRMAGYIPIDRENRQRAIQAIHRAQRLLERGISIVIYPEGTRSRTGELGPLKKGGFHMALEMEATVVPITFSGSFDVQQKGSLWVRPGNIRVTAGQPIDTRGMGEARRDELIARVRAAFLSGMAPDPPAAS